MSRKEKNGNGTIRVTLFHESNRDIHHYMAKYGKMLTFAKSLELLYGCWFYYYALYFFWLYYDKSK